MNRDAVTLFASTLRNVAISRVRRAARLQYQRLISAVSCEQSRNKRGTETDYNVVAKFYALCSVFHARYNLLFVRSSRSARNGPIG